MRKSNLAKYEREKQRQERMKKGIAFLIIFVMVAGTFAFVFTFNSTGTIGRPSTTVDEFGLSFSPTVIQDTQLWRTEINGVEEFFYLLPSQVGYYDINDTLVENMRSEQFLVLAFNTSNENASFYNSAAGIMSSTLDNLNIQLGVASTDPNNQLNISYIDCFNTTVPAVTFQFSNETFGLDKNGGCYEISAFNGQELFLITEFLRYRLLGADLER